MKIAHPCGSGHAEKFQGGRGFSRAEKAAKSWALAPKVVQLFRVTTYPMAACVLAVIVACCCALPVPAQVANAPLGLVGSSTSAHIGNAPAAEGATVYSGDYLSTESGGSLLVRVGALSVELQSASSAHIYRAPYGAVLELNSGSVIYSTPGTAAQNVVIVASDVRVTPVLALADFGRVSVDDPCNVNVQSQRGQVNVRVGSESHLIEEGKAYRVRAENSVSYRKYVSPEDADYHDYHQHKPCAAPFQNTKGHFPQPPSRSNFLYLAGGGAALITIFASSEALESPSRP